ncbi:MAG: type II toxin-antitoxin system VapC family toxin [Bacteroidales bacterium]|nr:type II toxin-antitoxin system VapC family toxin [Bacteroidales bacterium]
MRYLIDTNIFIDFVVDDYVSADILELITNYENVIYISSESIKEFVHLVQTERIILKKDFRSFDVFDLIENIFGFHVKYVSKEHLRTLADLELVENHNDPNDRLIISQAITEKMPLISSDTKFPKYQKHGLDLIYNR